MRRLAIPATIAICSLVFGATNVAAAPPAISGITFSSVTTDSVIFEAKINPNGKATKYRFEYGSADCAANPCTSIPVPDAALPLPPGSSPEQISAKVEGLSPSTKYHFRVVAKSTGVGGGETKSPDTAFATYHLAPVFGPCPTNEGFRKNKPSAKLPDCRAYEQASPVAKNGGDARGVVSFVRASLNGDRVSFVGSSNVVGTGGAQELPIYLSSRSAGSWLTDGLLPPESSGEEALVLGWTPDFSQVFDRAERFSRIGGSTLLSRSSVDGSLTTIVPYGSGLGGDPRFAGVSADGSKVVFEDSSKLTTVPAALEGKSNLYLWDRDSGTVSLADVFNDGTAPPNGAFAGPYDWGSGSTAATKGGASALYTKDTHAIAADGSVYFTAAKTGQLYLRRNPTKAQSPLNGEGQCTDPALACTLHLSATHRTPPDTLGAQPAAFMAATPDGSTAFFTSHEELTNDANTGPEQDPPAIVRADLDGEPVEPGFLPPAAAAGIAVDDEYVYWANPVRGTIGRAKLNGVGGIDENFITGAGVPQYVAVDDEYVYWTNSTEEENFGEEGQSTIGRADINGTSASVKLDFITGATNPQGIAVNATHVFWLNTGDTNTRKIGRADLGGGDVNQAFIDANIGNSGIAKGGGVAVDATHIYFTYNFFNGSDGYGYVIGTDLDGSNEIVIYLGQNVDVRGVAVDAGHVYWVEKGKEAIGRADLDLTEASVEKEFIKTEGSLKGIAVDASHLYWSANGEPVPSPGNDLYRYQVDSEQLTDLTPDSADQNGAEVQGVLGASDDGSYVYFVANADLDGEAGPATGGDCNGTFSEIGGRFSGECNIYLAHEGTIAFVARLHAIDAIDTVNWQPEGRISYGKLKTSRVSPDGRTLLFSSQRQLTAYDNEGVEELYRYRVGDPAPTCVSCNPTGAAPTGTPGLGSIYLSALVPDQTNFVLSRNLSTDGNRVFFETPDALVAADTNGEGECPLEGPSIAEYRVCLDVYEWEAKGTGSCQEDVQGGGCIYLLSTGTTPEPSYIADASASGDDVFLITRSQLVGQDEDQLLDVYDVSVDGGLASQNQVPAVPCEGEACKGGASSHPDGESAGSATFVGPPNPKAQKPKPRCPKAKRQVRSKGKTRCVAKKHHKRNAKSNRRASR